MAASNESHLAAVLSVDVAEVSEDGLKRVREAFTNTVDHHGGTTAPEQADGLREIGDRVRGWFSNRSSWVDRREAQIRAQLEAAGKSDNGRVARRMKSFHAFRSRARTFAGVTGVLFVINVLTSAGDWWFLWPAVVMAYVLALSALKVFGLDSVLGDDWEDRKRRELVAQFERERETA